MEQWNKLKFSRLEHYQREAVSKHGKTGPKKERQKAGLEIGSLGSM
jgi:hypothetical protein